MELIAAPMLSQRQDVAAVSYGLSARAGRRHGLRCVVAVRVCDGQGRRGGGCQFGRGRRGAADRVALAAVSAIANMRTSVPNCRLLSRPVRFSSAMDVQDPILKRIL